MEETATESTEQTPNSTYQQNRDKEDDQHFSVKIEDINPDSFERSFQYTLRKSIEYLKHVHDYYVYQFKKIVEGREELKMERSFVTKLKEELNIEKRQLVFEREMFEKEKKVVADRNVDTEDVIRLNVAGVDMSVLRKTLTSVPGSMLEAMFSGRHQLQKDDSGRYFLNRNPDLFKKVIGYLRDGEMKLPSYDTKGNVTRQAVLAEFDFFCIPVEKELQSKEAKRFLKRRNIVEYKTIDCDDWLWCLDVYQNKILSGTRNNSISIWDMSTGECVHHLKGHRNAVKCLEINGNNLVSGSEDRTIKIWDLNRMKNVRSLIAHTDVISCLRVVGTTIYSGSFDTTIKIWDLEQESSVPQSTLAEHTSNVLCIDVVGPKLFSGAYDNLIKVWDITTGKCIQSLQGHSHYVRCVKATENKLITGSYDKTIKIWDLRSWECIETLTEHEDYIRCIEVIGHVMVSGSNDKTLKIWDMRTHKPRHTLTGHHDFITCLKVVDSTIISGSLDRTIKIWTPEEVKLMYPNNTRFRSPSVKFPSPRDSPRRGRRNDLGQSQKGQSPCG